MLSRDEAHVTNIEWLMLDIEDSANDMHAHLLVLYTLARFLPAKVIVEIGTDDGTSTLPLVMAAQRTGGIVHSVDPEPCPHAHTRIERAGLLDHWRFHQMKSEDFDPLVADLVFIDGDHSYQAVRGDLLRHGAAVRLGGIVVLHDSMAQNYPGVGLAVHDFLDVDRGRWERLTLRWCHGLTICRRIA